MLAADQGLNDGMTRSSSTHSDVASVERFIPAPADRIFAILADPSRHQEIDGSGTVRGAKEGSQQLALGSTFGMSMKAGFAYSMLSTIIEFEPDRRIAWQTRPVQSLPKHLVGGRIWRYELEPREGGTLVRESWDISQEKHNWAVRGLRSKTIDAMTKTLERIETALR
jgi:uncharacterized protein YndB with AHSA1/START domain